jgi:hypothetical protein
MGGGGGVRSERGTEGKYLNGSDGDTATEKSLERSGRRWVILKWILKKLDGLA